MVNGVPREVPRPKPEGPSSRTSKEESLSANGLPRDTIGKWRGYEALSMELNPNMLGRDVKRMVFLQCESFGSSSCSRWSGS